ncbi:MAG: hypothetical protein QXJ96_02250 [Candidatus Aenigmatarchaeota archaeon]|nr:hypothetical protein [Candidatus Aenigmarchaeota archaeon]
MPRIILTAIIFILLLSLIGYILFSAKTFPLDFFSFLNISSSQKQSNFHIEIEVKEFLLKSEIEEIILKSSSNYSIVVGEILLDTISEESTIFNFSGSIQKKESQFSLIGRFSKANINKINITGKEIKILNNTFEQISLNNFKIDYIKFENTSGRIKIPNIELNIENATLEILNAFANLTYNGTIKIEGVCNQIKVNNKLLIASS